MRMLPYLPTYTKSRALVLRFNLALWALLEAASVSTRRGQLPAQGQTPGPASSLPINYWTRWPSRSTTNLHKPKWVKSKRAVVTQIHPGGSILNRRWWVKNKPALTQVEPSGLKNPLNPALDRREGHELPSVARSTQGTPWPRLPPQLTPSR